MKYEVVVKAGDAELIRAVISCHEDDDIEDIARDMLDVSDLDFKLEGNVVLGDDETSISFEWNPTLDEIERVWGEITIQAYELDMA